MKLSSKLIISFLAIFLLISVGGYITFIEMIKIETAFDEVEKKTTPALIHFSNIKLNLIFVSLEVNEYLLEPTEEHLNKLDEARRELIIALISYEMVKGEEKEEEIKKFKGYTTEVISFAEEIINSKNAGVSQEFLMYASEKLDEMVEEVINELDEEIARELDDLNSSHRSVDSKLQNLSNIILVFILSALLFSIGIGFYLSKSIAKESS